MKKSIDPAFAAAVAESARAIEQASTAEIAVEVRARSGSYAQADLLAAGIAGYAALLFVLFSPWTFEPWLVPIVVLFAAGAAWLLSSRMAVVRRLLTPAYQRDWNVRACARTAYVDRGLGNTRSETGLLIYLSLLERRIELIADRGVLDAVPVLEWNQLIAATRNPAAAADLLAVLQTLQPLLTRYLPARPINPNELSDEVVFTGL